MPRISRNNREDRLPVWRRFPDPAREALAQEFERIRSARLLAGARADDRMVEAWDAAYGSRAAMQQVIDAMAAQTPQDGRTPEFASSDTRRPPIAA